MNIDLLRQRAEIIKLIRNFFDKKGYLEIETPVLSPSLIPESPIEVFRTERISPYEESESMFLTPSPEIWMKKAISKGAGDIFQITKSFRNSEQKGKQHNNEFTMMEWYTMGSDYMNSLKITEDLFLSLYDRFKTEKIKPPFRKISVRQAFLDFTGIDLDKAESEKDLKDEAERNGYQTYPDYNWEETFNSVFLSAVEPELPDDIPVVLLDYPAEIRCLAKKTGDKRYFERWELYLGGIEAANCYSEETDKNAVEKFFIEENMLKKKSAVPHPVDFSYIELFGKTFPPCSGVAMGIDRLVMAVTGAENIKDIVSFIF